jgi:hypothetical protein
MSDDVSDDISDGGVDEGRDRDAAESLAGFDWAVTALARSKSTSNELSLPSAARVCMVRVRLR